jgi:hypothetical protein
MLSALGAAFRDEAEEPVGAGGGHLHEIHTIDTTALLDLSGVEIVVAYASSGSSPASSCSGVRSSRRTSSHRPPTQPACAGSGTTRPQPSRTAVAPFDPSPQLSRFHACSGAPAKVIGPTRPGRHADEGASGRHGNRLAAGHDDDVADASLLAPDAKLVLLPVGLVRGHPRCEDTGVERVRALPAPTPPWWRTRCRPDLRCSAAVPVGGPGLRRVELAVDQRAAFAGGVGEEHPSWQFSTRPAVPEYWRWTHLPRLLTDIDHRGQLGCPSSEAEAGREAADAQFSEVR